MGRNTPRVYENWLEDESRPEQAIRLDSAAWFAWLEEPSTTRFAYPVFDPRCGYIVGVMTVRKERRKRGGWYWSVYRRAGGRLHKHYLGCSAAVTQVRLTAITVSLLEERCHTVSATAMETT
jgi:LuxR family maltose regulon positive regulatory protein